MNFPREEQLTMEYRAQVRENLRQARLAKRAGKLRVRAMRTQVALNFRAALRLLTVLSVVAMAGLTLASCGPIGAANPLDRAEFPEAGLRPCMPVAGRVQPLLPRQPPRVTPPPIIIMPPGPVGPVIPR